MHVEGCARFKSVYSGCERLLSNWGQRMSIDDAVGGKQVQWIRRQ